MEMHEAADVVEMISEELIDEYRTIAEFIDFNLDEEIPDEWLQ